jgi:hypothetical protein
MIVELFGVVAVSPMVVMYALEQRGCVDILGFAAFCEEAGSVEHFGARGS